ncbi:sugar transferase [Brevundimonas sp.]|jgi:exopolysaccharide production protein ExoY|uniref:sugar transferase n=1 Tax=Brevundimonas sp. TaxID=1871086 RepID=UPI0025C494B9|nr:sugar transferase [Brevundimonas sp.]
MTTVAAVLHRTGSDGQAQAASITGGLIRFMDVVVALGGLIFFFPTLLMIAVAVKLQDGGPSLFRHERVGRGGRPFACLKFRSMTVDAQARLPELIDQEWIERRKLRQDPRVTRLGRFLRLSSLDELPQLINVLKGDMSLVGPRPIVEDEIALYGRHFAAYRAVRPGLTGLWQVSGRNDIPYPRRVAMDVWLVRNLTVRTYLVLLARTVPAVLTREGVH